MMNSIKIRLLFITIFVSVLLLAPLYAQETVIRYKRYSDEVIINSYISLAGQFAIESEEINGQLGMVIDIPMSQFLVFSPEVLLATDDFSEFSINVAGIINARFASEGTVPFIGAGIGLNIPTSRTLSTELVIKGNIGVTLDETFRIVAFYTTPIDHISRYNNVGLLIGIQL